MAKLKKYFLEVKEILDLLVWAQGFSAIEGKKFNYEEKIIELFDVDRNVKIDVSDYIDELFVYLYKYYESVKKADIRKQLENNPLFIDVDSNIIEESIKSAENFINTYNKLILTYKFDNPNSRGIQKNIMLELIQNYIVQEKYEMCADLRDKINEI